MQSTANEQFLQTFPISSINLLFLLLFNSFITAAITYFFVWLKLRLVVKTKDKIQIEKDKRKAFRLLLDRHSDLILGEHIRPNVNEWAVKYSAMSKNFLLWASDSVVANYGRYALDRANKNNQIQISDREIYFAKAIIAFRKGIGYKNWFGRVKPEHIIMIFKAGYDKEV